MCKKLFKIGRTSVVIKTYRVANQNLDSVYLLRFRDSRTYKYISALKFCSYRY